MRRYVFKSRIPVLVFIVLTLGACGGESRADLEAKIPAFCRRGESGYSKACVREADVELAKKLGLGDGPTTYVDKDGDTISGTPEVTSPATGRLLAKEAMPPYRVVFSVKVLVAPVGLDVDVVIESLSTSGPKDRTELICRSAIALAKANRGSCYSTEEAQKANNSAAYSDAHPGAVDSGYLGRLELADWTPAL